ncbi:MAG: hypothetical protein LC130_12695 [Bryobacterales bacterium]|nr:hypothetical protein [Bryobacterales bacterium]
MKRIVIVGVVISAIALIAAQPGTRSRYDRLPVWPTTEQQINTLGDKYVFRDASTGEVVIAVPVDRKHLSGPRQIIRHRPQNQVEPTIRVHIAEEEDHKVQYRYTITNGKDARLAINAWCLILPTGEMDADLENTVWGKIRLQRTQLRQIAQLGAPGSDCAYWSTRGVQELEIEPGRSSAPFALRSTYLPGFTTSYVRGGLPLSTPGDLPLDVAKQLMPVMGVEETHRVLLTIGPRFSRSTDPQVIATDYQRGIEVLRNSGELSESSDFYRQVVAVLDDCSRRPTKETCSATRLRQSASVVRSLLEGDIAAALTVALP